MAGMSGRDIHHVAVSRNPRAHLWRKAAFAVRHRPKGELVRDRSTNYNRVRALPDEVHKALGLTAADEKPSFHWVEHHPAHLASTFFVSPFDEAAVAPSMASGIS